MKDRQLVILSAASLVAFAVLAVAVKVSPDVQTWDLQTALWVNRLFLGATLDSLLVWSSLYGREYFWVLVVGLMLLLGDRRTKLVGVGLCVVFVVGIVAGDVAKQLFARPRPFASFGPTFPYIMRLPVDADYSFPSGHALIVSIGAVYSLVAFKRKWLAGLLTLEAAVVCFSRVYTFEHFPTDVFAGVALGAAIALGGPYLGRRYARKYVNLAADYLVKLFRDGPLRV